MGKGGHYCLPPGLHLDRQGRKPYTGGTYRLPMFVFLLSIILAAIVVGFFLKVMLPMIDKLSKGESVPFFENLARKAPNVGGWLVELFRKFKK